MVLVRVDIDSGLVDNAFYSVWWILMLSGWILILDRWMLLLLRVDLDSVWVDLDSMARGSCFFLGWV